MSQSITTVAQVDIWRALRSEHQNLEFKEAKTRFDSDKLYQYCVALANEGGGHLLLGIEDKPPRKVVGSKAYNNLEKLATQILQVVKFRVDIEEVAHPDGRVVVFHVPSRPHGTAYQFKGSYLMRSGASLVSMSEDRLRTIFAEGQPDWVSLPAKTDCDDGDVVRLLDTHSYFDLMSLPYPANRKGVLERFESEDLIERKNGRWTISKLGAILFAKRLDEFQGLARKAARVIVYDGKSKLKTKSDNIGNKGYAIGFQGLVEFIYSLVPANEVIEQSLRREVKMFPEIAVRELVANALFHQDFNETGTSVMIELYDDRMEVSNPGKPFIPPDRFIDDYKSRNEVLTDLVRRFGLCEEKGSGVDKVISAVEDHQLPAPDFRTGERRTSVVLFAQKDFKDMKQADRIRACYQHCCLCYVMNKEMTNPSLRDRFNLPERSVATASTIIAATVNAGSIKLADPEQASTRYRSYIPFWA